jgi:hypothetical protein
MVALLHPVCCGVSVYDVRGNCTETHDSDGWTYFEYNVAALRLLMAEMLGSILLDN